MIIDSGIITGSLQVSGSLIVTGSSNFQGNIRITGSLDVNGPITGAITGSITNAISASYAASASYALNATTANSATTATSASYALNATTANSATTATSASYALNAATASYILQGVSSSFASTASSVNTLIQNVVITGSLNISNGSTSPGGYTGSLLGTALSASRATSADNAPSYLLTSSFNSYSGSVSTRVTNLESTASTLTSASSSFALVSASYSAASGSQSTRVTNIETTYATTGSNTFTGNNVFGNITASNAQFNTASIQYLTVIYETSSVIFNTGSNQLGDASNDTQTFWGRVNLPTGPLTVTGSISVLNGITGSLVGNASTVTTNANLTGDITSVGNATTIGAAKVTNAMLVNSSVTVTAGTGMSGGGAVALGSSVTLTNAGVTSAVAGTAISVSGATGAVTINNTGVTSNVAGTGVSVSGATGAVTISIGQAVATSSNVQFNSLGVGTAGSTVAGEIRATADITAYYSSDERLKEDITPIENPIEKLMAIDGVTFSWKEGFEGIHSHTGADTGVIAQQVEALELPGIVTTRETGYMAVNYEKLNALLIEGFKVQQTLIHSQQSQIDELKVLVNQLLNK